MFFLRSSSLHSVLALLIGLAWAGFAMVTGRLWPHETTRPPDNFVRLMVFGLVLALASSWWFAARKRVGVAIARRELEGMIALGCAGVLFAGLGLAGMNM